LIPARNEEQSIGATVEAALRSQDVELEVLVLDDHSEDATATLVGEAAARDRRLRLVRGPELTEGWSGKTHACWVLAQLAAHDLLLFLDADVRLVPDGLARLAAFLRQSGAHLVSSVPFQETRSLMEQLLIPLIHFVLLGFLPLERMRASGHPAYAAGCGQLFLVQRSAYQTAGGHFAIRSTLHDGLELPRSFRAAGLKTDLCDASGVATCRMYQTGRAVWRGLAKNATEGLASSRLIVPSTLLLLLGQVAPVVLLSLALRSTPVAVAPALAAVACSYYPRLTAVRRFGQPVLGAVLHPIGVLTFLAIEWWAFMARALGRPREWKGRAYRKSGARDERSSLAG
jgi:hypothetical protein